RKLVEHPNHIEFAPSTGFPSLDDHFRWIVHCVVRDLQLQALTSRVRRLVPLLLGHLCSDGEFKKFVTVLSNCATLSGQRWRRRVIRHRSCPVISGDGPSTVLSAGPGISCWDCCASSH